MEQNVKSKGNLAKTKDEVEDSIAIKEIPQVKALQRCNIEKEGVQKITALLKDISNMAKRRTSQIRTTFASYQ